MGFKKGEKGKGGRPKGVKNGEGKYSNLSMNTHNYQTKQWERNSLHKTFDIDEVDYYIYNDLDITELMDAKKLPSYSWKGGNNKDYKKQYNLNSKMKAKQEKENGE